MSAGMRPTARPMPYPEGYRPRHLAESDLVELNAPVEAPSPRAASRAWRRLKGAVGFGISALLFVGLVANLVLPLYSNYEDLMAVQVVSGSMEPGLMTGTVILVDKKVNTSNLSPGTAITFMPGEKKLPVTHRIVEVIYDKAGKQFYVTKGDNNEDNDPGHVAPVNVAGTVKHDLDDVLKLPLVGAVPLGQWIGWATSLTGRITLFAPAVLAFVLTELAVLFSGTLADPRTWRRRVARLTPEA